METLLVVLIADGVFVLSGWRILVSTLITHPGGVDVFGPTAGNVDAAELAKRGPDRLVPAHGRCTVDWV